MKKLKIKITPENKRSEKLAKILEFMVNSNWEVYGSLVEAVVNTKCFIDDALGYKTPSSLWENILREIVNIEIKKLKHEKQNRKSNNSRGRSQDK